jgi:hypothetical protein
MGGYLPVLLPDAEGVLRAWLRDGIDLAAATDRVFFAVPAIPKGAADVPLPLVTLARVGGLPDDDLPLDHPVMRFNVWGTSKKEASAVARRLVMALRTCGGATAGTDPTETAMLDGASDISGPTCQPDDAAGKARYIVVATIHMRPMVAV